MAYIYHQMRKYFYEKCVNMLMCVKRVTVMDHFYIFEKCIKAYLYDCINSINVHKFMRGS